MVFSFYRLNYMQRLRLLYQNSIVPVFYREFSFSNVYQVPVLSKIVLNRGLDDSCQNNKVLDNLMRELTLISGQKPCLVRSSLAIANFKLKKNMPVSLVVTLRREKMYAFLDRIVNLVLPRVRDFQGLPVTGFDSSGNFNFSISGLEAFPEIESEKVSFKNGINISIYIKNFNKKLVTQQNLLLLKSFGVPFKRDSVN